MAYSGKLIGAAAYRIVSDIKSRGELVGSKFDSLSEIQGEILKNIILSQQHRPFGFSFQVLYGYMDISKYSEDEVSKAINSLAGSNFIKKNGEIYEFTRDQYLETKSNYKKIILINQIKNKSIIFFRFIWKYFILTIITSIITAYFTTMITLKLSTAKQENTNQSLETNKNNKQK